MQIKKNKKTMPKNGIIESQTRRCTVHNNSTARRCSASVFRVGVVEVRREAQVFLSLAVGAQGGDDAVLGKFLVQRAHVFARRDKPHPLNSPASKFLEPHSRR